MRGPLILFVAAGLALSACEAATSTASDPAPSPSVRDLQPKYTGRVVDQAALLSNAQEERLSSLLERLEDRTSDQFVIVTVRSLGDQPIEDFSRSLSNEWGIGQADKDNGVLLLLAPNERKVRIEVGYGLDPILTNAKSGEIIQRNLLPYFREARWFEGIEEGANAISELLVANADTTRRGRS